jgi:acetyl-CoA carboxylase biotin carboxyl carrier protein
MDFEGIRKLVALMNRNGLSRLEVQEDGRRYVLEKAASGPAAPPGSAPSGALPAAPPAAAPPPQPPPAAPPRESDVKTFNSPMVGTFYTSSSPDTPPFVKPGDRVAPETTLCLIEAMKVFNEIKADMHGVIADVLAENQEAVEYNQPLFLIRPA